MINDLVGLEVTSVNFWGEDFVVNGNPLYLSGTGYGGISVTHSKATINCQLILDSHVAFQANVGGLLHVNGNIDLNGNSLSTDFAGGGGGADTYAKIEIAGAISGTGDVRNPSGNAANALEFQGTAENTFTGTLYLSSENGCLLNKEGGFLAHRIVVYDPYGFNDGEMPSVRFLRDNQIDPYAEVVIQPGATLALDNHYNLFYHLEMQGGVLDSGLNGNAYLTDDIRINATNETAVIKGHCTISTATSSAYDPHPRLIVNGPMYPALDMQATVFGLGGFSKSGSGAMYLSVSNYFLGELVISNGIVGARNDNALGRDYTNSVVPIKGVWLEGGTLLLRNVAVSRRDLHVDQTVNSSPNFELPGAFITCVGTASGRAMSY